MVSFFFLGIPVDPFSDIFGNISWIFEWLNGILVIFFSALKYVLFALLIIMSVITFLKFKKNYSIFHANVANKNLPEGFVLKKKQFFGGIVYMILAFGILFNFITYFMLAILDPIPDRFALQLLNSADLFNSWALDGVINISNFGSPIEMTAYYVFAVASLICFVEALVSIWLILTENIFHIKKVFLHLFAWIFM
jgi:hypothetical protein